MPDYDAQAVAAADAALRAGDDEDAPVGLAVFEAPDALHAPPVRPADLCQCGGLRPADRRGVVDISIKLTTLARLDEDPGLIPGWEPVIAEIARRVAFAEHTMPSWMFSVTDEDGKLLHHGHIQRRPTAAEAAFTRARDQVCATPGCRRDADQCDLDHRLERERGGPSHHGNLGPACGHDHRLRTNHRAYQVAINVKGIHTWTAPNGRRYLVGPQDRLSLTADLDNPTTYQQPPLPDPDHKPVKPNRKPVKRNQKDDKRNQKDDKTMGVNEHNTGYSADTQNAFNTLIRKYVGARDER